MVESFIFIWGFLGKFKDDFPCSFGYYKYSELDQYYVGL